MHHTLQHDAQDVVIVLKLGEDTASGASVGEAEIDYIHAVDHYADDVGNEISPECRFLPDAVAADFQRQEHQHEIERIQIEQGGEVETHAAEKQF